MTREQVEKMAQMYYTKDEIKILLRGFDIGIGHAKEVVEKAFEETINIK